VVQWILVISPLPMFTLWIMKTNISRHWTLSLI
jgi:hypothetical protein